MDLSTSYLGLKLRTPLVPSASPLSDELDNVKKMEDAGASAVVLHSVFEEQVRNEQEIVEEDLKVGSESFAEALTYFPQHVEFRTGPEEYLSQIRRTKEAVAIPVIASLNGAAIGGWVDYAAKIEEAGADALELNIYTVATDPDQSSADIEQGYLDILRAVKSTVTIPVAVKLSPFFSNMAAMAKRLDGEGADGLVLFNRFYQPDIDLEALEMKTDITLSTSPDLRLPLRWVALLHGRLKANLAATGGIHTAADALKMLMAGADVTMLCSVLLRKGIGELRRIETEMSAWMAGHDYQSVEQLKGTMSRKHSPDPSALERAQYVQSIMSRRRG